jgi:outer membrane biosynthesis protein TonB
MKTLTLSTLLIFGSLIAAAQKSDSSAQKADSSAPDGLQCFDKLTPPEFPTAALQQHVDGSVWTYVNVGPQGSVDKIDTQVVSAWSDGAKLLTPPVEKAIRAATFKPACHGKQVSTVFRYQLVGEPVAKPETKTNSDSPRMMVIESHPLAKATESAKK